MLSFDKVSIAKFEEALYKTQQTQGFKPYLLSSTSNLGVKTNIPDFSNMLIDKTYSSSSSSFSETLSENGYVIVKMWSTSTPTYRPYVGINNKVISSGSVYANDMVGFCFYASKGDTIYFRNDNISTYGYNYMLTVYGLK